MNIVSKYNKATEKASEECKKALEGNTEKKSKKRQHDQYVTDNVLVSSSIGEAVCVGISLSDPNKVGPIDKFVCPIDRKSNKEEALRQLDMNDALFKESASSFPICC
jgi:hypothetical protein